MSSHLDSKRLEEDIRTLLLNIEVLRERIELMTNNLRKLVEEKESLERAIAGLKSMSEAGEQLTIFLDPKYNAALTATSIEKGKALVFLGFNIYARLSIDQAVKVLEGRRAKIEKSIEAVSKTLSQLVSLYNNYSLLLQQLTASQAERKK
ncbi:MAG: hypothetical protein QXN05_05445 [Acidilobaceae archaeon]